MERIFIVNCTELTVSHNKVLVEQTGVTETPQQGLGDVYRCRRDEFSSAYFDSFE